MTKHLLWLFTFFFLIEICVYSQDIKIHYLGHSAFVLQFDDITVVTDYGKPNAWKQWGWDSPIHNIGELIPDIMTYSHLHEDHYDSTRIPQGVKHILINGENLELGSLKITAIRTCEDKFGEFNNYSYLFSYKGVDVLHTGDIQGMIANIENNSVAEYFKTNYPKDIDLLIMPIEGKIKYIPQAESFICLLNPKSIIPTHSWSPEYMNDFISYTNAKKEYMLEESNNSDYIFTKNFTSQPIKIIVLKRSKYLK